MPTCIDLAQNICNAMVDTPRVSAEAAAARYPDIGRELRQSGWNLT